MLGGRQEGGQLMSAEASRMLWMLWSVAARLLGFCSAAVQPGRQDQIRRWGGSVGGGTTVKMSGKSL